MRLAPLTNVTDDSPTMLRDGLTTMRLFIAVGSHQWRVGHLGTAVHFV